MSQTTRYSISNFITDAKAVLAKDTPLEDKKIEIASHLTVLSKRDDLSRFAMNIGAADTSPFNYLLWREPPYITLLLSQWDDGYRSPIHEHGDFWVIGCGYRGRDRWDIYERLDDGARPGYAHVEKVDQVVVTPGVPVWMPAPPRAIHSHNNEATGWTQELIFAATKPPPSSARLVYDVDERTYFPSLWRPDGMFEGEAYPKYAGRSMLSSSLHSVKSLARRLFCPACDAIGLAAPRLVCSAV